MQNITLAGIFTYPLKSGAGNAHHELSVEASGLSWDRSFVVCDTSGRFLTARKYPKLLGIRVACGQVCDHGGALFQVMGSDYADLHIEQQQLIAGAAAEYQSIQVWGNQFEALALGDHADRWVSEYLGADCRLYYRRQSGDDALLCSFADAAPILVISQPSLDALNDRLETPALMEQFRPNLVVSGCAPHAEDSWQHMQIGGVHLKAVAPCSRCVFVNINPHTQQKSPVSEPLHSLRQYRSSDDGIAFGQYFTPVDCGTIHRGDSIAISSV